MPRGESGKFRLTELVGGFTGTLLHLKGLVIEDVGEALWRGKVFFRDERVLRNRIEDLSILKKMGLVEGEPKKMQYGGKETWLLFPAKLYCGQSMLDARRESIIIDYFFTDEIPGYQESPDFLAGRRGLKVRDEIRMIRAEFHPLRQGHRRQGAGGIHQDRHGAAGLLAGHPGPTRRHRRCRQTVIRELVMEACHEPAQRPAGRPDRSGLRAGSGDVGCG